MIFQLNFGDELNLRKGSLTFPSISEENRKRTEYVKEKKEQQIKNIYGALGILLHSIVIIISYFDNLSLLFWDDAQKYHSLVLRSHIWLCSGDHEVAGSNMKLPN